MHLSVIKRSSKNKYIDLKNIINDQMYVYKTVQPTIEDYVIFKQTWNIKKTKRSYSGP